MPVGVYRSHLVRMVELRALGAHRVSTGARLMRMGSGDMADKFVASPR